MPFGVLLEPQAGLANGAFLPDAGDDVLQEAPLRGVIERVADGDERHLRALGEFGEAAEPARLVGAIAMHRRQIGSRRRGIKLGQPSR